MQNSNGFALVAVVALALACFGIYTSTQKRSCECPAPRIHDGRDWDKEPVRRPRRPDGSTGETGTVGKAPVCPDGKCDTSGIVKRDM